MNQRPDDVNGVLLQQTINKYLDTMHAYEKLYPKQEFLSCIHAYRKI